jgi:hypothetical protein
MTLQFISETKTPLKVPERATSRDLTTEDETLIRRVRRRLPISRHVLIFGQKAPETQPG